MSDATEFANRLQGQEIPSVTLHATNGAHVDLSKLTGVSVVFAYPRTSPSGGTAIPGWEGIPGAKGCTPQACGFRDFHQDILDAGASQVFGLSVESSDYQAEARDRLHLPYELLSDSRLELQSALDLPTFSAGGMTLLERFAMVLKDGAIAKVFHPIPTPAQNAEDVLSYLSEDA